MSKQPESRETIKAQEAYYHYLALGPDRSFPKLAEVLGHPPTYIRNLQRWSALYDWVARAKAHDAEELQKMLEAKDRKRREEIEKMNARHAKIGVTQQTAAIKQIEQLIEAKAFGSLAAVQLLKLSIDVERVARELPDARIELTGADGGPIVIKTVWGTPKMETPKTERKDE
jgi:hypothetical protein